MASTKLPSLPYIEDLIGGNGDISLGRIGPIDCAATANDEARSLAMLVRRDGETLVDFLVRLESAIQKNVEEEIFIDEINNGPDDRI